MKSIISTLFYTLDNQYNHMQHLLYFLNRKQFCSHGIGHMLMPVEEQTHIRNHYHFGHYDTAYISLLRVSHFWPERFRYKV